MIGPGFGAWLAVAMLLWVGGFLAAMLRAPSRRASVAVMAMLAASLVCVAAMVRHRVLDDAGLGLGLVILAGGAVLLTTIGTDQDGGPS